MASKFYFSYLGNKRLEMKYLKELNIIKFDDIETIVEPYCGSCAFSLWCYFNNNQINKKYILNDFDKNLIGFLKDIKEREEGSLFYFNKINEWIVSKDCNNQYYKDLIKNIKNIESSDYYPYYVSKKFKQHREGIFNILQVNKPFKVNNVETDAFYKNNNVSLFSGEAFDIIEKYKDDPKALLFLDPPYFNSNNQEYEMNEYLNDTNEFIDDTKIFIDILRLLESAKCKIILVINGNSLLHEIYKKFIKKKYIKTYFQRSNKNNKNRKTYHIVVANF